MCCYREGSAVGVMQRVDDDRNEEHILIFHFQEGFECTPRGVTRVFTRIFKGSFKGVTKVLTGMKSMLFSVSRNDINVPLKLLRECHRGVTRVLRECYKDVTRVFTCSRGNTSKLAQHP
jgi:hypothetical protein